ncbi:MAG: NAD(P)/FAD-dependent oxidoreductase [Chloroflexi bacterium]|nr:NAD(P)/FAD-dependent oxidoreductase [Chloroflexota bacterium]
MAGSTVLILGGGWGGMTVATVLRGLVSQQHRIQVVERKDDFYLCLSLPWVMTGERKYPSEVSRPMSKLSRAGVEWVHGNVRRIDPEKRIVEVDSNVLQADYLVIAMGARLAPGAVPGFTDSAFDLYTPRGANDLHHRLSEFDGGRVVILVSRAPFRCPAAPYEAAFLAEWMLRRRGVRARAEIAVYTPERHPMPVAGPIIGQALASLLSERSIQYHPQHSVTWVDGPSKMLRFDALEVTWDLLIGIPPHVAPKPVKEAGLTDSTGYIPVHPQTLEILADVETLSTRFPGVYAIGDATSVRLLNQMLLPKAGIFAEAEARVVAQNIAAQINGKEPLARFDGRGMCYIEVGDGLAARSSGNFYAYPAPTVTLEPPSPRFKHEKEDYEAPLKTWFSD